MSDGHYKIILLSGFVLLCTVLGILMLYAHTIMPALKKLNDPTFVASFQSIDRHIINPVFMFQFFAPLFLLGAAAYYAHKHNLVEAKYLYIAVACYLVAIIVTLAVNVPLNDGIKRVTETSASALTTAREQFNEAKWVLFNHIRTILTLIATVATSAALWVSKTL